MMTRARLLLPLLAVIAACSGGREVSITPGETIVTDGGPRADAGSGRCVPACSAVQTCVDGECVVNPCGEGETRCGAVCIDTATDLRHCGSCTKVCPSSTTGIPVCSGGECGLHCTADPEGSFCPASSGKCASNHCCGTGQSWCGDHCASTLTDLNNCGGCDKVCSAMSHGSASCSGGTCTLSCASPYQECDGVCSNYATDPVNCGSCGRSCGTGASCSNGNCVVVMATCTISPASGWQSCGSQVQAADMFEATASGNWVWSPSWAPSGNGPTGTSANPVPGGFEYRYDINFNYGALLWRAPGGLTDAFFISTATGTAGTNGFVQFRINDEDTALSNNTGSMTVSLKVTRL